MPNFAGLQQHKTQLIRKALGGSLFMAESTAITIGPLVGAGGVLTALPTGWSDAGLLTPDGLAFSRSVDLSTVTSFGESAPTRTDVTADTETVATTFQETSKLTISAFTGAALSSLVPNPTTGELVITKPDRPAPRIWRLLSVAVDENAAGEIYISKYFPRSRITDYSDQAFATGDDPIQWGLTFQAEKDSTLGFAVRYAFGGPGWNSLLVEMGFPALAA
jgi:hypothetical protein